ncbi:MAG: pyridoxamine 5'-phosphate oxidase family protein [Rubricella sp.]
MSEWWESLDGHLDRAWSTLSRGVADRRAPARHLTLATIAQDGAPALRTVVLRGARRSDAVLEVHTDARSAKVAELRLDPRAAVHIWDPKARFQIRLSSRVEIVMGDAGAWASVPPRARAVYGEGPPPGAPVPEPVPQRGEGDQAAFTRLLLHLDRIETLHLGEDMHRRAAFLAPDWAGGWIAP